MSEESLARAQKYAKETHTSLSWTVELALDRLMIARACVFQMAPSVSVPVATPVERDPGYPVSDDARRHTCFQCNHKWKGRTENPASCPRCKSQKWNEPKAIESKPVPKLCEEM
jgi:rubrerythrin